MPLLRNPVQPFFPDQDAPNAKSCATSGSYCHLIALGDEFYQQWYQTPCGPNLVCDPDFADFSLGAEMVTNGSFTTNANNWDTGAGGIDANNCPVTVDAWCYNTDGIGHDGTAGNDNPAYQDGIGLVNQTLYQVAVTVRGRSSGSVYVALGDGVNEVQSTPMQDSMSYTFNLFYQDVTDRIKFVPSEDFDGTITEASVKPLTYACWNGNQDTWVINSTDGVVCAVEVNNIVAINFFNDTTPYITSGDYIEVHITASDIVSGSVQLYIDDGGGTETNLQTAITTNGEKTYYITASQTGVIGFKPSLDFVGCLSSPDVRILRTDYPFEIIADSDGSVYDISSYAQYEGNKVTFEDPIFDLLELQYGCYTINAYDACQIEGDNLVSDPNFAAGDYTDWQRNNGSYQYDMTGGALQFIFEPLEGANLITNGGFASGASWTAGTGWTIAAGKATHTPGNTGTLSQTVTTSTPAVAPNTLTHWWQLTISNWTTGTITVTLSDKTSVTFGANDTITSFLVPTIGGSVTFSINPSSNFDGDIDDVSLHESTRIWSGFPVIVNTANTDMIEGTYELEYTLTARTGSSNIGVGMGLQGMTGSVVFNTTLATHTISGVGYVPGNQRASLTGRFRVGNTYYPGRISVDAVSAVRTEPFEANYTSECFVYRESFEGTKLITAYCNDDQWGSEYSQTDDRLSFATTEFKLKMRVACMSFNPDANEDTRIQRYTNGSAAITYSNVEKKWQFITDLMSDSALYALRIMARCDHFLIGDSEADSIEYVAEDIQVGWQGQGDYNLTAIIMTLRKAEKGMRFNRHV